MAPDRSAPGKVSAPRTPGDRGHFQEAAPPSLWLTNLEACPALADKFRQIKHHLNVLKNSAGLQVFALTAPHQGAGVTTLTANLALLLSWDFMDQRILLVDGNLKKPALHLAFGREPHPGLPQFLTHGAELAEVRQSTARPNLEIITGGDASLTATSPFDLKRFQDFLAAVRHHYDFVLVDCPPVFETSDSQVICSKVDGVVLVAEANRLRYEVLLACVNELTAQARLIGCIFNKRQFVIPGFLYRFV